MRYKRIHQNSILKFMKNKIGIVMGVANERSLAWGITKYLSENGAKVILTYQGEALKKRVVPLAEKVNSVPPSISVALRFISNISSSCISCDGIDTIIGLSLIGFIFNFFSIISDLVS